jgi:hypothetical protein
MYVIPLRVRTMAPCVDYPLPGSPSRGSAGLHSVVGHAPSVLLCSSPRPPPPTPPAPSAAALHSRCHLQCLPRSLPSALPSPPFSPGVHPAGARRQPRPRQRLCALQMEPQEHWRGVVRPQGQRQVGVPGSVACNGSGDGEVFVSCRGVARQFLAASGCSIVAGY